MSPTLPRTDIFPFDKLPAELRNEIYYYCLCDFEPVDRAQPENPNRLRHSFLEAGTNAMSTALSTVTAAMMPFSTIALVLTMVAAAISTTVDPIHETPVNAIKVRHSVNTAILRVSKQIYHEAYALMIARNLFVRITYQGAVGNPETFGCAVLTGVPVIAMHPEHVLNFNGYAAHHSIRGESASDSAATEFMILHRDLDKFCLSLGRVDFAVPWFKHDSRHILTLSNLFPKSALSSKLQELVLEPYAKHLTGFSHFSIMGAADAKLEQKVVASITKGNCMEQCREFLLGLYN